MGRMYAEGIAETDLPIEDQITWHLRGNFYPPVPVSMVAACVAAIHAGNDQNWDLEIDLPEGVLFRGKTSAPAHAIIENHRLDTWIDDTDF
jgi:hypothetical protein